MRWRGDRDAIQRIGEELGTPFGGRELDRVGFVTPARREREDRIDGDRLPRVRHRARRDARRQRVRQEHVVVGQRHPLVAFQARFAAPEPVFRVAGRYAEHLVTPLCERCGVFHRRTEAGRFALERAPRIALQPRIGHACGEADDDEHDEHFSQRESAGAHAVRSASIVRVRRASARAYRSHEPMSVSKPVPPGWPSAP